MQQIGFGEHRRRSSLLMHKYPRESLATRLLHAESEGKGATMAQSSWQSQTYSKVKYTFSLFSPIQTGMYACTWTDKKVKSLKYDSHIHVYIFSKELIRYIMEYSQSIYWIVTDGSTTIRSSTEDTAARSTRESRAWIWATWAAPSRRAASWSRPTGTASPRRICSRAPASRPAKIACSRFRFPRNGPACRRQPWQYVTLELFIV